MVDRIDADTGEKFRLFLSKELIADLQAFRLTECQHTVLRPCERMDAGGAKHVKRQCQVCGEIKGTSISRKDAADLMLYPYLPNLEEEYQTARQLEEAAIYQKHIRKQKAESGQFSKEYRDYLASDKWRIEIRNKIMKRAGGICEGCLERPATQVHHANYSHLGDEFMFELIAICDACHKRLHVEEDSSTEPFGYDMHNDGSEEEGD